MNKKIKAGTKVKFTGSLDDLKSYYIDIYQEKIINQTGEVVFQEASPNLDTYVRYGSFSVYLPSFKLEIVKPKQVDSKPKKTARKRNKAK